MTDKRYRIKCMEIIIHGLAVSNHFYEAISIFSDILTKRLPLHLIFIDISSRQTNTVLWKVDGMMTKQAIAMETL